MTKRGLPGVASGNGGSHSPFSKGHKQTGQDILPSRHAMSQLTAGSPVQRSLGNYAKMTPTDADGQNNAGQNIISMGLAG